MKAIETVYNGYRFRSRLEARWAVFFDSMHWKYQYELEGYEFEDGTRYLPDFWLPEYGLFVEIKGEPLTPEDEKKVRSLWQQSGHPVIVLDGPPWELHTPSIYADQPYGLYIMFIDIIRWTCDKGKNAAKSARFEHGENGAPA